MRLPRILLAPAGSLLHDLRDGWHESSTRRWLWIIVVQFALLVALSTAATNVLGPR